VPLTAGKELVTQQTMNKTNQVSWQQCRRWAQAEWAGRTCRSRDEQ